MNRTMQTTVAAILAFLFSAFTVMTTSLMLISGAASPGAQDSPPFFIFVGGSVSGAIGLVAAYGVWKNQKWGKIVTVLVRALDGLGALPGVFFAPSADWQLTAALSVVISVVIIVLLLWRAPKPVTA